MKISDFREKKQKLEPIVNELALQLSKKDLTVLEAEIVTDMLSKLVKPSIEDKKLSDFI
ncbi:hypothetical protein H7198_01845 [Fructobacillus sp. CRL 2054]|uniref:hypothetical protein n=1 Tax=Fructobacillus sp. CRL 2054 TaxID=2763007 RepID=UPI002379FCD7|nr:hypothetical protein [Fructobacillus sp. CRL 2054]MDD9138356.1 hypothetical protein [Fructobacillus sp. CRL 2054]